ETQNMRTIDLILKKRDGEELSNSEIEWFVQSFTSGSIPDYQIAAMSMAIFFRGMTARETTDLTIAMANSGDTLELSDLIPGVVVDKHSTGGVGDKTTLVLAPIVSACGVVVAKISGRGLGHGGGTLDKLEAIPGLQIQLTSEQFRAQIKETGIVVAGQSSSLAPADGKLYKIRDVTGTVASNALIASSIMSKKFAAGAQAIVLDVKTGNGAFMTTLKDAQELAELMVAIGRNSGRKTVAVISDMNQPLGYAVGNALEVREAIETLRGDGPPDLREHCLKMAGYMLHLSGKVDSVSAGSELASNTLKDGTAFQELMKMVSAQGGDTKYVDNPEQLEKAKLISTVTSTQDGFLSRMDAINIGKAAVMLGAGREQKNDPIDLAVGIVVHQKVGSRINTGDPLFTIHANNPEKINSASEEALAGIDITIEKSPRLPLHYDFIE
ncbi:MAG TPA: thymidine phosphorylase, partial [Chloroflexi bacterium]|nr:thymidine phosphorylase [Chloroflexota bacterium]